MRKRKLGKHTVEKMLAYLLEAKQLQISGKPIRYSALASKHKTKGISKSRMPDLREIEITSKFAERMCELNYSQRHEGSKELPIPRDGNLFNAPTPPSTPKPQPTSDALIERLKQAAIDAYKVYLDSLQINSKTSQR